MRCPHCAEPMQAYVARGLPLDRCGKCGRVWLDLDEVDRLFGLATLELSDTELDRPCPRGHGALVSGSIRGQAAAVCPRCRGALIDVPQASGPDAAPPEPSSIAPAVGEAPPKQGEIRVKCQVCGDLTPLSEAAQTSRGTCCRSCELSAATYVTEDDHTAARRVADLVVDLLSRIVEYD